MVMYIGACTHMPSGEKAFKDFDSCFASNLGLAAAGGIGFGILSSELTKKLTGDRSTANAVGVAAGVAAAAMIGMKAWSKCSAVYNTSEAIAVKNVPASTGQPAKPGINLDRLEVRVEGSENDAPVPEFDFNYISEDPAAKDIKAKFRHKVEIVRFVAGDQDKLVLADAKGAPLLDSAGLQIPLGVANKMPRERLQWVTIAEEGRDDYVEDVVIQQGHRTSYRHKLQIPPRAQLPLPLPVPMRYTLSVEVDKVKTSRTVDFSLLGSGERPKRFKANASAHPSDSAQVSTPAITATRALKETASSSADTLMTHSTRRQTSLFSDTKPARKRVSLLGAGIPLRIEERVLVTTNNKTVEWLRVMPQSGTGGWIQATELVENK
ncbi:MAG: hypothetical protein V4805_09815 [Pseudomonadota bacterium]